MANTHTTGRAVSPPPDRPASANYPLAVMVLLAGTALRVYHLGVKSIWWDEAHSWWYARMPLLDGIREGMAAWHGAAGDPLFTVALHLWISLVGDSALAMRALSTLVSLLTFAMLGRITARAFGWRTGRVALFVGAIAPIWVFYSQEVRQYALTPGIMLIIIEAAILLAQGRTSRAVWIQLAIGEALALYTHSFLVFAVASINVWLGWLLLRQWGSAHRWRWLRSWVISQLAVLVLIAPTLPNYILRARAGHSPFVESLSLPHILNAQWSLFFGIPWQHATGPAVMRLLLGAVLILILPLLALALRGARSRLLADLLWWILLADALTAAYWMINPVLHPRYMLFLTGPLFAVISVLLSEGWKRGWSRAMSLLMAAALVMLSLASVRNLYAAQLLGYRHDPARDMTAMLRSEFGAGDGIITIDPNDYTIWYYGAGEAEVFRAGLDDGDHTPADLVEFMTGKDRIGVVQFHAEQSDKRHIIPFYLERYGWLADTRIMESYGIYIYQMDALASPELAAFEPAAAAWAPLVLVGQSTLSSDAVTVALEWQAAPEYSGDVRYASLIRLIDPETDWVLGTASTLILNDAGEPTSEWSAGERATQYYVLPLYPGTPPLEVEVTVMLVDSATGQALDVRDAAGNPAGQRASIDRVILGSAPARWIYSADPPFTFAAVESGLLGGYVTDWPTTAPGGSVGVTLNWAVMPAELTDQTQVALLQEDRIIAIDNGPPLQGRPPAETQHWLDRRILRVDGEAQSGMAQLVVMVGSERIPLGEIEILGFQRSMERPAVPTSLEATFSAGIRLLGYALDVPDPVTASSTITLNLYWEALEDGLPGQDYTVFAQILDPNGRLVGQHDSVPVYGTRPVSGWLAGEFVLDEHPMTFKEPYTGPVQIQVGLYNPATFERLRTENGHDAVILPIEIVVESAP